MKIKSRKIIKSAREFVTIVFRKFHNTSDVFHNLRHTKSVVKASRRMAKYYNLCEMDRIVLLVAAWFHDVGYYDGAVDHEVRGADAAGEFLFRQGVPDYLVTRVKEAILTTQTPQHPVTLVEKILCDADVIYFGKKSFLKKNALLLAELELRTDQEAPEEWRITAAGERIADHQFFTEFALRKYSKTKQKNVKKLMELRTRQFGLAA